ncbi:circadian clock-controlled protein daywake [Bicyclus anynana]|uniref:Circadian clock-controlled protein daywake n=1 Tax=Bicyclus anynana TaxID=110368 RepID=A0A6J1MG11_BICAN|nr:circadian clock-controlled protein daywake [Bicyclus anynana]
MKKSEIFIILVLHIVTFVQLSHNKLVDSEVAVKCAAVKCALNDSVCLTKQAQNTLQSFVKGIPELGIQKIDKLHIDDVIVHTPKFHYAWVNITVAGMKNAIFDKVSINREFKYIRVLFHTNMVMEFDYKCDGILLSLLRVYGDGIGNITLNDIQMEILFMYDIVKDDNGKDIMDLHTYYYGANSAGGVRYYFSNIFDGDVKKSELLLDTMNESWRIFMSNFGGYFNRKITDKLYYALKIYLRSCPLEEIAQY